MSGSKREEGRFYVYGIFDPLEYRKVGDKLASVCYVGKGTGDRAGQHEKDAAKALTRDVVQMHGSKVERLAELLDAEEPVQTIMLARGFHDEDAAYAAETIAMELISRLRAAHGLGPLVNSQPGHGQSAGMAMEKATAADVAHLRARVAADGSGVYFESSVRDEDLLSVDEAIRLGITRRVDVETSADELGLGGGFVLVKGSTEDMTSAEHRRLDGEELPPPVAARREQVRCLSAEMPAGRTFPRRGWDVNAPWGDEHARERARRYWPLASETVGRWLDDPASMPEVLLMAIPAGNGDTTVRYVWRLDPEGTFEYFPELKRWGLPLGERLHGHPAVGACLTESRGDRSAQVLQGYASGIRVFTRS